jgi:hypothetical protein
LTSPTAKPALNASPAGKPTQDSVAAHAAPTTSRKCDQGFSNALAHSPSASVLAWLRSNHRDCKPPHTVNRSVQLSGPLDAVCRMKKSFTCCSAIYHCASWHRQRLLCGDISLLVHKHSTPLR